MPELNPLVTGDPPYVVGQSSKFTVRLADYEGDNVDYLWAIKQPDGSYLQKDGKEITPEFRQQGDHKFTVTAGTDDGSRGHTTVSITVEKNPPLDLSITVTPDQANYEVGESVTVEASPDYEHGVYGWTVRGPEEGVQESGTGKSLIFTPRNKGWYDIELFVKNSEGRTREVRELLRVV
jgi:hypothetical protein